MVVIVPDGIFLTGKEVDLCLVPAVEPIVCPVQHICVWVTEKCLIDGDSLFAPEQVPIQASQRRATTDDETGLTLPRLGGR